MARVLLNYTVAALLGTAFLALAFTGIQIGLVIPKDIHALWGVSHGWWARVHLYLALAFMLFVIVHFGLHWDWLRATSRVSRLHSMGAWSVLVVMVACASVYLGLRSAPERSRVLSGMALGRRVYLVQECDACHAIQGVGGTTGPDLTKVRSRRDPAWLRAEIVNPASHEPDTKMPAHELSKDELDALVDYLASLK